MIDELVLERIFTETADEIPVPERGAEGVVQELNSTAVSERRRRPSSATTGGWIIAAAAAVAVVVAVGLSSNSAQQNASKASLPAAFGEQANTNFQEAGGKQSVLKDLDRTARDRTGVPPSDGNPSSSGSSSSGAVDGAKIVKTGTLDLQVPHATLHTAVNRVTGVAVGLGGYIADSKSNFGVVDATAQITIRVPVNNFEAAVTQLERLPDVKVLRSSENGSDVTAQSKDLEARLSAKTAQRDSLLSVLGQAESIGDILSVGDRITAVQTEIDQLQGQINLLNNQATFSSIAITLAEKPAKAAAAATANPPTGLSKAWHDARDGFSNALEWIIARSGGALIVLLAGLLLLFGIRYLYPVVRRGLL